MADTVREAVLLYKEWVFQGLVVEGLDNIYKMLGSLSSQMKYMQNTLDNIEANTASMCNNMYEMIKLHQMQIKTQEKVLEETVCTRYAAESMKRSNEKYEWYVEQHRQGLL